MAHSSTKHNKIQRRKNFWGYLFIAPNFIGFVVFMLLPILMSLYYSFTDYDVITEANFVGFENYIKLFQDDQFITALLNTLWYCVLTVPAGVILALLLAVLFNRQIPGIGGDFTRKAASGGGALIDWGVHYLDLILYCCGEPKPLTASGEAFCKLGKNIKDYVYTNMWAENTADKDDVFDVDDSVTGIVRTDGPTITFNGAWAENIGEDETYIDFIGDKAGIRLEYGEGFVIYSVKNGMLMRSEPKFRTNNFYEAEINSFVDCVINHEHNRADIDLAIGTSKIMQAIYDLSLIHI